jgi:L-ribulose-5-phosphate 4-epimerase
MLEQLKKDVLRANLDLDTYGLVTLTWGNVSGIDRERNAVVIKPSGVAYDKLRSEDMVVIDMDGNRIEGDLNPSSDTATHIQLYKAFPAIGGIAHSHSEFATIFAQACLEIPCFGTTHADLFNGPVPITRFLTEDEVQTEYERNTGRVIVELFNALDYISVPGVLVAGHAPFTWGSTPKEAVMNNLIVERIAKMALFSKQLAPELKPIPEYILKKHYERKHGPHAYYGQHKNK